MANPKVWGVDSAQAVNESLLQCVTTNYGKPSYWGRYLVRIEGASEGLTREEIQFIHSHGIKILPIYNAYRRAVGMSQGIIHAKRAIEAAKKLGVPKGTYIFANIEKFFAVDASWIRGWVDTVFASPYRPGIYANPVIGNFRNAYCQAANHDPKVKTSTIIWSSHPHVGATKKTTSPTFHPATPPCPANVWGWQYGESAPKCPVDTNLIDPRLFKSLW